MHTPGPWSYRAQRNLVQDEIGTATRAIATAWVRKKTGQDESDPWPEGEANLRLIVAAPGMFSALQMIASGTLTQKECVELARNAVARVLP